MRRALPGDAGDIERVTRVPAGLEVVLVDIDHIPDPRRPVRRALGLYHPDPRRHRGHRQARHGDHRRRRRAFRDFAVGQRPIPHVCAALRPAVGVQFGAFFEGVVHPPKGPHALGEVGVEVAVED